MSEEDDLRARIGELEKELESKDYEINGLLDKIEDLEEKIFKLEYLIPKENDKKKGKKQQVIDSKLSYIEEKDREIRELRNRMGFLRKEKVQLQQELEKIKNSEKESSVIRVEDLREKEPLNLLVRELQEKVNKQRNSINRLEVQNKEVGKFKEILKEKEDEIDTYKSEILELNQKLKDLSFSSEGKKGGSLTKKLVEDLQTQLSKAKRHIIELNQKITKYEKKPKKKEKKEEKIVKKEKITEEQELSQPPESDFNKTMITLKENLQSELKKAKFKIQYLEAELKKSKTKKISEQSNSQKELDEKLKTQREMVIFLQKQLDIKEGEFETIKNEAVQIKKKYRQLENQMKLKDQKINELLNKLERYSAQTQPKVQPQTTSMEDPHLKLRLNELKNMIDDLEKRNYEQRIEISQLRKKI